LLRMLNILNIYQYTLFLECKSNLKLLNRHSVWNVYVFNKQTANRYNI